MTETATRAVVYLDSMTFIFEVEGEPSVAQKVKPQFEELRRRPGVGVTSELTLAEVLAGRDVPHSPMVRRSYLNLIVWSRFFDLVPIYRDFLYESADLRFAHRESHGRKLKLADAIHLVTAIRRKYRYFVSADKGISPPSGITRIDPDAKGIHEVLRALA